MNKLLIFVVGLISWSFFVGCSSTNQTKDQADMKQGIKGQVVWEEGNMMPGPDKEMPAPKGIQRKVHIFPLLTGKNMDVNTPPFYSKPNKKAVAVVESGEDGRFEIGLPAGKYSILIEEEKGFFSNLSDGEGHLTPIEIKEGAFEDLVIKVNYMAAY